MDLVLLVGGGLALVVVILWLIVALLKRGELGISRRISVSSFRGFNVNCGQRRSS